MPHNHFIKKCSCGKVISQCRCMAKDKTVLLEENGCAECRAKIQKADASGSAGEPLLCCPFCGHAAEVRTEENRIEVCCTGLGCYAKRVCMTDKKIEAIKKWNERAI